MLPALILSGYLQFAYIPSSWTQLYENPFPEEVSSAGSFIGEVGATVSLSPFYLRAGVLVPMWSWLTQIGFYPYQLQSEIELYLKLGEFTLGYLHLCAHPVTPYVPIFALINRQIVPRWEGGYDMFYVRFGAR